MRFRVVPTHHRGIPRPKQEIARADGVTGELVTANRPDALLRGTVIVALLTTTGSGAQTSDLLPPLYLATLRLIAPQGMMLSGHERIAGADGASFEFAQGWWARPA